MAQTIYIENNDPLDSFNTNQKQVGILEPGVYRGFDVGSFVGTDLTINHSITGVEKTERSGSTKTAKTGVVLTRQGSIVHEDASIVLSVDDNDGNAFVRTDYIVGDHAYQDSPGGVDMTFLVIKGPLGSTAEPSLTNPLTQVLIGKVVIQPSVTDHSTSVYTREDRPGLANREISLSSTNNTINIEASGSNRDLDINTPTRAVADFNNETTTGVFVISGGNVNAPSGVSGDGTLIVSNDGNVVSQIVLQKSGVMHARHRSDLLVWTAWSQMIRDVEYDNDITNINSDITENTNRIYGVAEDLGDIIGNTEKTLIQASEHPAELIVGTAYWHAIQVNTKVKKLKISTPTGGTGHFIARVYSTVTNQPWVGYKLIIEIVKAGSGSIGVIGVNANAFTPGSDVEAFQNAHGNNNILIADGSGNYVETNLNPNYFPPGSNTAYFEFNAASAIFKGAHFILECVDNSVPQNAIWLLTWANRHTPVG